MARDRRLREDQQVVANLSLWGLGLLAMLVLSLMGLSITAGGTLSPERPLNLAPPGSLPAESPHHIRYLP